MPVLPDYANKANKPLPKATPLRPWAPNPQIPTPSAAPKVWSNAQGQIIPKVQAAPSPPPAPAAPAPTAEPSRMARIAGGVRETAGKVGRVARAFASPAAVGAAALFYPRGSIASPQQEQAALDKIQAAPPLTSQQETELRGMSSKVRGELMAATGGQPFRATPVAVPTDRIAPAVEAGDTSRAPLLPGDKVTELPQYGENVRRIDRAGEAPLFTNLDDPYAPTPNIVSSEAMRRLAGTYEEPRAAASNPIARMAPEAPVNRWAEGFAMAGDPRSFTPEAAAIEEARKMAASRITASNPFSPEFANQKMDRKMGEDLLAQYAELAGIPPAAPATSAAPAGPSTLEQLEYMRKTQADQAAVLNNDRQFLLDQSKFANESRKVEMELLGPILERSTWGPQIAASVLNSSGVDRLALATYLATKLDGAGDEIENAAQAAEAINKALDEWKAQYASPRGS